jgi:hypothetical protein
MSVASGPFWLWVIVALGRLLNLRHSRHVNVQQPQQGCVGISIHHLWQHPVDQAARSSLPRESNNAMISVLSISMTVSFVRVCQTEARLDPGDGGSSALRPRSWASANQHTLSTDGPKSAFPFPPLGTARRF